MTNVPAISKPEANSFHSAVPLRESFRTWCRVALLSFGGPAGQIAVMHRILVVEKKWVSEEQFLHALNYCMLLPGPEAQQLATYIGWLMHRALGGLMAGLLFILPGFSSILVLSIIYASNQESSIVQSLFFGLKAAVIAIVIEAVLRIGKRVLKNRTMVMLAASAFVSIFFFDLPFPILVVSAGLIGLIGNELAPERFEVIRGHGQNQRVPSSQPADATQSSASTQSTAPSAQPVQTVPPDPATAQIQSHPSWLRSFYVSAICLTLWFAPLLAVWLIFGSSSVYFREGVFFSKAAVVTFGGAYSVLTYIAQQAVEKFGWLGPGQMLDGLGMAETTPGPLIMVVQFVGFMGAYHNPGPLSPLMGGIMGSILTTWVTFVPCFFWVFLGAPYVERLRGNRRVSAALSAITAAVVGVIMNLAVWFSLHTWFIKVTTTNCYGLRLQIPDFSSANLAACLITLLACLLTFYWRKGMFITLVVCSAVGAMIYLIQNNTGL